MPGPRLGRTGGWVGGPTRTSANGVEDVPPRTPDSRPGWDREGLEVGDGAPKGCVGSTGRAPVVHTVESARSRGGTFIVYRSRSLHPSPHRPCGGPEQLRRVGPARRSSPGLSSTQGLGVGSTTPAPINVSARDQPLRSRFVFRSGHNTLDRSR